MRSRRLLIPLVLLTPLALASPAMAADRSVSVTDFAFGPPIVNVDVGNKVTWNFVDDSHTTQSDPGQAESWNSNPNSPNPAGTSFEHTFTKPGRFGYICRPHPFMEATVVVGSDQYPKSQSSFRQVRRGKKITFRFTLVEPARVVAKLKGPSPRSATRRRLRPGSHAIAFNRLRNGQYRGTVTFTDDYDKKSIVKTFTVVR
jgi:plastocyanin